jgi:putative membrane protein
MTKRATFIFFSTIFFAMGLSHSAAQAQLSRADRTFLKEASGLVLYQQEASKLATIHAVNPGVKNYAENLLRRHASAGLAPLARSRGVTAPLMQGNHRMTLNQLAKARGAAFDNLYIQKVALAAQRDEMAMLERAGPGLQDPAIRLWVQGVLPSLREQLAVAARLGGRGEALSAAKLARSTGSEKLIVAP